MELIRLSYPYVTGKDPTPTPEWRIQRVKNELMKLPHSPEFEQKYWPMVEKALHDPGTNRMFQEEVTDGLHSEFLAPSVALMPASVTLEMPFQRCINMQMQMAEVTPEDPFHRVTLVEQGYQYTRVRTATTANFILKMLREGKLKNALILNCGRLLEFRYFPELEAEILQSNATFHVNDTDPTIDMEELFPNPEYRRHFHFYCERNDQVLKFFRDKAFELVVSMGHAIYSYSFNDAEKNFKDKFKFDYLRNVVIDESLRIIRKDGLFLCDIQPNSLEWQKLLLSLSWKRLEGMNIALPPHDTLVEFVQTLLMRGLESQTTMYQVPVKKDGGEDVAGYYIAVTK